MFSETGAILRPVFACVRRKGRRQCMADFIKIQGARQNNLKDISLDIPRDKLVVITGLSGSGKSSLAFDTIYAEGQRRYVESLSAYARQFLGQMDKPDVDHIEGLSPAVSIDQKSTSRNPRSTVGTVTEIYDYLRLLFARVGIPHDPVTGLPLTKQTMEQMVDRTLELPEGTRIQVMAPVVRAARASTRKRLTRSGPRASPARGLTARCTICRRTRSPTWPGTSSTRLRSSWTGWWSRSGPAPDWRSVLHPRQAAGGLVRDGGEVGQRVGRGGCHRRRAAGVHRELRGDRFGVQLRGDRAALVLVQLALRRVSRLSRAGHQDRVRPRSDHPRQEQEHRRRGHRALCRGDFGQHQRMGAGPVPGRRRAVPVLARSGRFPA